MSTTITGNQIRKQSLVSDLLQPDFLNGNNLNLTDGKNNATITGLKAGTEINDISTVENLYNHKDSSGYQDPVKSILSDPTTISPSNGDRYIVSSSATNDWVGKDNMIAEYRLSTWVFITPFIGMQLFVIDQAKYYYWNGTSWQIMSSEVSGDYVQKTGDIMTGNLTLSDASLVFENSSVQAIISLTDSYQFLNDSVLLVGSFLKTKGSLLDAKTFSISDSTTTWVRLAQGSNISGSRFKIKYTGSSQNGFAEIYVGISYSNLEPYAFTLLNNTYSGDPVILYFRICYDSTDTTATYYLDMQIENSEALNFEIIQLDDFSSGWQLVDTVIDATVPDNYDSTTIYVRKLEFRTTNIQCRSSGQLYTSGYFKPGKGYKSVDGSNGISANIKVQSEDLSITYNLVIKNGIITDIVSSTL